MTTEGEFTIPHEVKSIDTIPCFRMVTFEELRVLDKEGVITREMLSREDHTPKNGKQDKLEIILLEYFDRYPHNIPRNQLAALAEMNQSDFIAHGLAYVTSLELNENEAIKKIVLGEATNQEIRTFLKTYAPRDFNIAVQTTTTTSFSNFFSVTYGGVLNINIPENCVLLELKVPNDTITIDPAVRNPLENELLLEKIQSDWVIGRYTTSTEVIEMLRRRLELPIQKFLPQGILEDYTALNHALHQSKGILLKEFLDNRTGNH